MIERTPDPAAAAEAAAHLLSVEDPSPAPAPAADVASSSDATSSPASSPAADAAPQAPLPGRDQLVRGGALAVFSLSNKAAASWGPHWAFAEEEALALSDAGLEVLELYVGKLEGPWAKLGIVLAATIGPRVLTTFLNRQTAPSPAPAAAAAHGDTPNAAAPGGQAAAPATEPLARAA